MLLRSSSEKILIQPLMIANFGTYLGKKRARMATPKMTINIIFVK